MQMLLHNCVAGSINNMFNTSVIIVTAREKFYGIALIEFPMYKMKIS